MTTETAHYLQSSLREKVLEHLFVGELLRCLWRKGCRDMEVLRAEVDRGGYDIVLAANGVIRHAQLKASHQAAKTREVGINTVLASKPNGCVIWIRFDPATMVLGPYLWFGADPGLPLPALSDRVGRHTKGNRLGLKAERPGIRMLKRNQFAELASIADVVSALFAI